MLGEWHGLVGCQGTQVPGCLPPTSKVLTYAHLGPAFSSHSIRRGFQLIDRQLAPFSTFKNGSRDIAKTVTSSYIHAPQG
jgi:hypothetical protein